MRVTASLMCAMLLLTLCGCDGTNPRVATALNQGAAVGSGLPWNPMQGKVITSWIDPKTQTMATLFGNDAAVQYARSGAGSSYPDGSVLSAVTWTQKEDARWFGGKIPESVKSVEFVTVHGGSASPMYAYERYEGSPLKRVSAEQSTEQRSAQGSRAEYLLAQHVALMP